jgi:hypothetical protein
VESVTQWVTFDAVLSVSKEPREDLTRCAWVIC